MGFGKRYIAIKGQRGYLVKLDFGAENVEEKHEADKSSMMTKLGGPETAIARSLS